MADIFRNTKRGILKAAYKAVNNGANQANPN